MIGWRQLTRLSIAVTILVSLAAAPASSQIRYRITPLMPIEGHSARPLGINNFGLVAGSATNLATGGDYDVAVVWNDDGIATQLTGEGLSGAFANAVNDSGLMIGTSDSLAFNGFAVDESMNLTELEGFAPLDIDSGGIMVGTSRNVPEGIRAAIFESGRMQLLEPLSQGFQSFAHAINDSGKIVGMADTSAGPFKAVAWENFVPHVLEGVPEAEDTWFEVSRANDVNESGVVVGRAFISSFLGRAAVWNQSSTAQLLPVFVNDHLASSNASAINDHGTIVGQANIPGVANIAVIWQDDKVLRLDDLIDPQTGWNLAFAADINNRGQIVGWGYLKDQQLGFRLNLLGDVNLDGSVDLLDVSHFVDAVSSGTYSLEADVNQDDKVNLLDVESFVSLLTST